MKKAHVVARLLCLVMAIAAASSFAQSVTRSTFKVIEEVQLLMEAEDFEGARTLLLPLVEETRGNPYDHAIANQYLAHNSVMLDDTATARRSLETALASTELPPDLLTDLNLFYGTVLLSDGDYSLAAAALGKWYVSDPNPTPSQTFTVAYAFYMDGDIEGAEPPIASAINRSPEPQESWLQLHYRILFDLKRFDEAEALLYFMVESFPDNQTNWRMLASHYLQLERSGEGLATIMVEHQYSPLDKPEDLKRIASLYSLVEVPEKAARLLEAWIENEQIPTDPEILRQLGNMWLLARERNKAKEALKTAAAADPDGSTYVLLGAVHFEDEEWAAAHISYKDALRIGGLDDPLRISLLAGISAFRAEINDAARQYLGDARASPDYQEQADHMLRQLDAR